LEGQRRRIRVARDLDTFVALDKNGRHAEKFGVETGQGARVGAIGHDACDATWESRLVRRIQSEGVPDRVGVHAVRPAFVA